MADNGPEFIGQDLTDACELMLHPDGTEDKTDFPGVDRADALTMGEQDIKTNWRKYRQRYIREMKR
jgi:hypothetical protein